MKRLVEITAFYCQRFLKVESEAWLGMLMRTIEQRSMFGARMKIMWEEQLVDPTTDYLTSVNLP